MVPTPSTWGGGSEQHPGPRPQLPGWEPAPPPPGRTGTRVGRRGAVLWVAHSRGSPRQCDARRTQRDVDLAAWWDWDPQVLAQRFPSIGAGGMSMRDEVSCCTLTAQRGSCDPGLGPETCPTPRPCAEGGPHPSRAPQLCETQVTEKPGSPREIARLRFQRSPRPTAQTSLCPGGETPVEPVLSLPFQPPALGGRQPGGRGRTAIRHALCSPLS